MNEAGLIIVLGVILVAIYLKLCDLLKAAHNIMNILWELEKQIAGDEDDMDEEMIKPSVKTLIVERCLGIEHEIIRLKHHITGDNNEYKGA